MTAEPSARFPQVERVINVNRNQRVFVFYSLAVLLTSLASILFADLLWRVGWTPARLILLSLFTVLFLMVSIGCIHAVYGFILRRLGDSQRITAFADYRSCNIDDTSTALLIPIYNEDVDRTYAGVRAMYESVRATGHLAQIDFFILSDSTQPENWIEEERRWFELISELGALGRVYYRRRAENVDKKSGNIRDFLSAWGKRYRYFIVLDADSVMSGSTITDLIRLMEIHPTVGLIQTAPALVNARSAFARMQQFANRLYGRVFEAGLNYWSQDGGNYWGHNAIIRTEPFMHSCDLPKLPGKKPFGGHILSHDFIEAALLRKENWEVWFAWDLGGSYEEGPPSILTNAQRDRRWCQGNLQHFMLLFARGFRGISRIHLIFGIVGYLAGPIWLLFMVTGTYILWQTKHTGLSTVVVEPFTPYIHLDRTGHSLLVFGIAMTAIFLPKILSLVDLLFDADRRRSFGGFSRAAASVFLESLFSTLHAPIQMLMHSKFVVATLFGASVRWSTQERGCDGTDWKAAFHQHWTHTAVGLGWGGLTWWLDPGSLYWFLPVLAGMVLSIPLSVLTSRERVGQSLLQSRLFLTPEELDPPVELRQLNLPMESVALRSAARGIEAVIVDPYVNAIHISLLREREARSADEARGGNANLIPESKQRLAERLLNAGASGLSTAEKLAILADSNLTAWLHREIWRRPAAELANSWRKLVAPDAVM